MSKCGTCSGDVGDNVEAILCDGCGEWYHAVCGRVSSKLYNKITSAPEAKPVAWKCSTCKKNNAMKKPKRDEHNLEIQTNKKSPNLPQDYTGNENVSPNIRTDGTPEQIRHLHNSVNITPKNKITPVQRATGQHHPGPSQRMDPLDQKLAQGDNLTYEQVCDRLSEALIKNEQLQMVISEQHDSLKQTSMKLQKSLKSEIELKGQLIDAEQKIISLHSDLLKISHTTLTPMYRHTALKPGRDEMTNPKVTHGISEPDLTETKNYEDTHEPDHSTDMIKPITEIDKLIIGDSIIRGVAEFIEDETTRVIYRPGARIQDLSKYLREQHNIGLPKLVVIHIRTNNIQNAQTPNHIMRPLWLTLEAATKSFPETKWLVSGILYRQDENKYRIDEINDAYKFMCEQLNLSYTDPNTTLKERVLGKDGIHLNRPGSYAMAKHLIEAMKSVKNPTAQDNTPTKTQTNISPRDREVSLTETLSDEDSHQQKNLETMDADKHR